MSEPHAVPDVPNPAPAKRGRKAETATERMQRLERELQAARQAVREGERRMYAVVGEALLAEAETDAALKERILAVLRRRVTGATARADIATLLV